MANIRKNVYIALVALSFIWLVANGKLTLGVKGEWHWRYKPYWQLDFSGFWLTLVWFAAWALSVMLFLHKSSDKKQWYRLFSAKLSLTIIIVVLIAFLLSISLQILALSLTSPNWQEHLILVTLSPHCTGYFSEAIRIQNFADFIQDYHLKIKVLPKRLATHPPGALFFYWLPCKFLEKFPYLEQLLQKIVAKLTNSTIPELIEISNKLFGFKYRPIDISAAFLTGVMLIFISSLTVVIIFCFTKALFDVPTAVLASFCLPLIPSFAFFSAGIDGQLAFIAILSIWLFWVGFKHSSWWLLAFSGLINALGLFCSLSMLAVVILQIFLLLGLHRMLSSRQVLLKIILPLFLFTLLPLILLKLLFGFDYLKSAQAASQVHHSIITVEFPRAYHKWLLFNLFEFFVFFGVAWTLIFIIYCYKYFKPIISIKNLFLGSVIILILVLDFSGSVRGETGRLWLFLMPLLTMFVAAHLIELIGAGSKQRYYIQPLWLLILPFLQLAQILVFSGRLSLISILG